MAISREKNRRRAFGQNFLIDKKVVRTLVDDISCSMHDRIIEIGPGSGVLTRGLLEKCRNITVIEVDPKWSDYLKSKSVFSGVEVIQEDAGCIPIDRLLNKGKNHTLKPIVVGNLPFNKSGPILKHFLPRIKDFKFIYIMVQYEVAKRMTASPHSRSFGYLSVFVQNFAYASLKQKIAPESFRPRPNVFSATVELLPLKNAFETDPEFFLFVRQAFTQKRKKIINSLHSVCTKTSVIKALEQLHLAETTRPEELGADTYAELFAILKKNLKIGSRL